MGNRVKEERGGGGGGGWRNCPWSSATARRRTLGDYVLKSEAMATSASARCF